MEPSKVHTTMLTPRVLEHMVYTFPLIKFIFTDGTVSTLNCVTWNFIANSSAS